MLYNKRIKKKTCKKKPTNLQAEGDKQQTSKKTTKQEKHQTENINISQGIKSPAAQYQKPKRRLYYTCCKYNKDVSHDMLNMADITSNE